MSKREMKRAINDDDADVSNASVAAQGYGIPVMPHDGVAASPTRYTVKPVSIFDLYPDFAQPRRIVPSMVRAAWDGNPQSVPQMLQAWAEEVSKERGSEFRFDEYLRLPEHEFEGLQEVGLLESQLLELVKLAVTIQERKALKNAITAARSGDHWLMETGERRWLAYHLLFWQTADDKFATISVNEVPSVSVWDQAYENSARKNLNAIGKARQFARLLIDMLSDQFQFEPYEAIAERTGSDRAYYAQVADGNEFRIPRGQAGRIITAMNLKSAKQLRDYRALLDLPDSVWIIADDYNLAEYTLRYLLVSEQTGDEKASLAMAMAHGMFPQGMSHLLDEDAEEQQPTGASSEAELPDEGSESGKGNSTGGHGKGKGSLPVYNVMTRLEKRLTKVDVQKVDIDQRREVVAVLERLLTRWRQGL